MSDNEHPVRLRQAGTNFFGAAFWTLSLDTRCDGRVRGGLALSIDIHTEKEGLCIAGSYISWEDLHRAEEYAKSYAPK